MKGLLFRKTGSEKSFGMFGINNSGKVIVQGLNERLTDWLQNCEIVRNDGIVVNRSVPGFLDVLGELLNVVYDEERVTIEGPIDIDEKLELEDREEEDIEVEEEFEDLK